MERTNSQLSDLRILLGGMENSFSPQYPNCGHLDNFRKTNSHSLPQTFLCRNIDKRQHQFPKTFPARMGHTLDSLPLTHVFPVYTEGTERIQQSNIHHGHNICSGCSQTDPCKNRLDITGNQLSHSKAHTSQVCTGGIRRFRQPKHNGLRDI